MFFAFCRKKIEMAMRIRLCMTFVSRRIGDSTSWRVEKVGLCGTEGMARTFQKYNEMLSLNECLMKGAVEVHLR